MLYDPVFAKSFSRYERKRLGYGAIALCFVVALIISSSFEDTVNLQLSVRAVEGTLVKNDSNSKGDMSLPKTQLKNADNDSNSSYSTSDQTVPKTQLNNTDIASQNQTQLIESKKAEPLCRILKSGGDYCEIEGDIRLDPISSTLFVVRPHSSIQEPTSSWIIKPYPRRRISYVKNWTVTLISDNEVRLPLCYKKHTLPAVLFSIGGYSGNHFHDFADLIFPLYSTSIHFQKEVNFIISDYKSWWPSKFRGLLDRLTQHKLVDIDREKQVHCYNKVIAGLKFYKELTVDPSSNVSMRKFREFLRKSYSLERTRAVKWTKGQNQNRTRPRLMIISRKRTRILTNEAEVSRVARKLGYDVVLEEADISTNLTMFARIVNSCDVLMGVHGAGLTNMLFLPDNAVLIQVVPFGGIEPFARLDFGDPAAGMNIGYLEYNINMKESSLGQRYPSDHRILNDPRSIHKKGWDELRSVYLDNQNVTIDIHRLKGTLAKALKLLRH